MALAAQLGPVGWIRSRLQPPKTARIELSSTTARDQSISPQRASQSSMEKWISCQMPASCQSRNAGGYFGVFLYTQRVVIRREVKGHAVSKTMPLSAQSSSLSLPTPPS